MKFLSLTITIFAFLIFATSAGAAALGVSENTARIGYGVGVAIMNVNDPQGGVEKETSAQLFQLVYSDRLRGKYRYWGEVFVDASTHEATETKIGQEVQRFGVRALAHRQFYVSDKSSMWVGGGLQFAQEKMTLRHTVDSSGFLEQTFGDRNNTSTALTLDIINEWHLTPRWDVAGRLRYSFALGDGIDDLATSVVFLYQFQD